jgi:serine-aspartate repeat-containing protein C/D/E
MVYRIGASVLPGAITGEMQLAGTLQNENPTTGTLTTSPDLITLTLNVNYDFEGESALSSGSLKLDARLVGRIVATARVVAPAPGSIGGIKYEDLNANGVREPAERGLANWTIVLDTNRNNVIDAADRRTITSASGEYTFNEVPAGTYRIFEVQQPGWTPTLPTNGTTTVTVVAGQRALVRFGNRGTGSISGAKFNDINGDGTRQTADLGLAGWTIYLDTNRNSALDVGERSVVTSSSGEYRFSNVGPGEYRVREVQQTGWRPTAPVGGSHLVVVTAGQNVTGKLFGNQRIGTAILRGIKFEDRNGNGLRESTEPALANWRIYLDLNNNGVRDVSAALEEPQAITNSSGQYSFTALQPGTYRIREIQQTGWRQTAPTSGVHVVTLAAGQVVEGRNFGNQRTTGTIRGVLAIDNNRNGIFDTGDTRLVNQVVNLDNPLTLQPGFDRTTRTNADGLFVFEGLSLGTWVLSLATPGFTPVQLVLSATNASITRNILILPRM